MNNSIPRNRVSELNLDFSFLDFDEKDGIENALNELDEKYLLSLDDEFAFNLKKYKLFNQYHDVNLIQAFKIDNGKYDYRITLFDVGNDIQVWGIAVLKRDFGHVLITKESIVEKIMDWIQPMDMDFDEDPEFSKKVFVVAKDQIKAMVAIDRRLRNSILEINRSDFLIEVINNKLIIGNRKNLSSETLKVFIDFLNKLYAPEML